MMCESVKKIVAREGFSRTVLDSSYDEMFKFSEGKTGQDFLDESILAIKFSVNTCEDDDTPEQSDWYINPVHFKGEGAQFPYNLTMDGDFVPEILLIDMDTVEARNNYAVFKACLMFEDEVDSTEEELYNKFLKFLFEED